MYLALINKRKRNLDRIAHMIRIAPTSIVNYVSCKQTLLRRKSDGLLIICPIESCRSSSSTSPFFPDFPRRSLRPHWSHHHGNNSDAINDVQIWWPAVFKLASCILRERKTRSKGHPFVDHVVGWTRSGFTWPLKNTSGAPLDILVTKEPDLQIYLADI